MNASFSSRGVRQVLKLLTVFFRTTLKQDGSQPDIQILQPINLQVLITRNLAASWYGKLPGVQVQGVLQSVTVGFFL